MSLFGFVKEIGRELFNQDGKAATAIQQHIEANNPGVHGLEVDYDNGIVGLSGVCNSAEAFEKCVLMAGNVQGVVDVYTSKLKVAKGTLPNTTAGTIDSSGVVFDNIDAVEMGAAPNADLVNQPIPKDTPSAEYYVIQAGDSLSKIAKQFYGDAMAYPRIFEANREVIEDPDKIFPGQKIRIPTD